MVLGSHHVTKVRRTWRAPHEVASNHFLAVYNISILAKINQTHDRLMILPRMQNGLMVSCDISKRTMREIRRRVEPSGLFCFSMVEIKIRDAGRLRYPTSE